jgi:hypothetical protein
VKFDPLIVTDVPTGPKVGVNEVIVGAAAQATPTPTDSINTLLKKTMANSLAAFHRCGSCIGLPSQIRPRTIRLIRLSLCIFE